MSYREYLMAQQFSRAVNEIVEQLPYMATVFQNPLFDLKKAVEHDLDFLLGAFLASVLERYTIYCLQRSIKPTNEEALKFNYNLFSRALEYKEMIRKQLEL
jgi:hypothetical protein